MSNVSSLQPTLWRTCRVLANRTRLKICALLLQQPGQTVSAIAEQLKLPLPAASQDLRALEARGLLAVRRQGRRVVYRPTPATTRTSAAELVTALRLVFRQEGSPVETIFKTATAFTHPRRIEIFNALRKENQSPVQLCTLTGISVPSLYRHLRKLKARGFVTYHEGRWVATPRFDPLGRELTRLAG
jgi:DNA-binding transcriptional ArsR family regulator